MRGACSCCFDGMRDSREAGVLFRCDEDRESRINDGPGISGEEEMMETPEVI